MRILVGPTSKGLHVQLDLVLTGAPIARSVRP